VRVRRWLENQLQSSTPQWQGAADELSKGTTIPINIIHVI